MSDKTNVRDKVREHLLEQMQEGNLEAGQSISLAALARKLKVSVTPVREALTQLQQSQIVQAIPNRGFSIAKVNPLAILKPRLGIACTICDCCNWVSASRTGVTLTLSFLASAAKLMLCPASKLPSCICSKRCSRTLSLTLVLSDML